jgi:triosephosphate isomerase (TIM)
MRQKIVAGNWKMNTTIEEGMNIASEVMGMVADEVATDVKIVIAPPATHLYPLARLLTSGKVTLAAQNCYSKNSGAFTGETSPAVLQNLGVKYVIVGHSERRQYFGETSQLLAEKVSACLENNLIPIFCCGETLKEREGTDFVALVSQQISEGLFHLNALQMAKVVIAYEPVWAIGTGKTASSEQAQAMHLALRQALATKFGHEAANATPLLYGGSVNAGNAAELFAQPDVDGGLVGGASLKPREFVNIIKSF